MRTGLLDTTLMLEVLDLVLSKASFESIQAKCFESGISLQLSDYTGPAARIQSNSTVLTIKLEEQKKLKDLLLERDLLMRDAKNSNISIFKREKYKAAQETLKTINSEIKSLQTEIKLQQDFIAHISRKISESLHLLFQIEHNMLSEHKLDEEVRNYHLRRMNVTTA